MPFVYILQSQVNKRYYIGSTIDLNKRITEHNLGKSKYTRLTKPFDLVFCKEYLTIKQARNIEYRLKKLKNRKIIERIISDNDIKLS